MQPTDATYRLNNRDLRIRRSPTGTERGIEVCIDDGAWYQTYQLDEDRTERDFERALEVAGEVFGPRRNAAGPNCSNSTTHAIWNAMRDVAGC